MTRSIFGILLVLHLASLSGLCWEKCCVPAPADEAEPMSSGHCHGQPNKQVFERASLNCRCHAGRDEQIVALAPQQLDRRPFATSEVTEPPILLGLLDLSQSPRAEIPARHTHSPPPVARRLNLKI